MFEAKITIAAPELAAAINNLANAMIFSATSSADEVSSSALAPKSEAKAENASKTIEIPSIKDAKAPEAEATQQEAEQSQPVKTYTLDDLSRAGAELIDQGKMPQLIEILKKNGVQAITQLKPEQYNAVAAELNALGANL